MDGKAIHEVTADMIAFAAPYGGRDLVVFEDGTWSCDSSRAGASGMKFWYYVWSVSGYQPARDKREEQER